MQTDVEFIPVEQTTTALVSGSLGDFQRLFAQQMQLTRREVEDGIRQFSPVLAVLAVDIGVLSIANALFCFGLVHLLHWFTTPNASGSGGLPLWACYLTISAVLLTLGIGLVCLGRAQFRAIGSLRSSAGLKRWEETL